MPPDEKKDEQTNTTAKTQPVLLGANSPTTPSADADFLVMASILSKVLMSVHSIRHDRGGQRNQKA